MDLRRELERDLDRFAGPDLWAEIEIRAAAPERTEGSRILSGPHGRRAPRLMAALVAFAVFAAAVVVLWTAFWPEGKRPATPSCATGRWQAPVSSEVSLQILKTDASPAGDVWVLGMLKGARQSVLLHLDGGRWSRVPSPGRHLRDIAALAPDDLWVLGRTQVWRFDGQTWSSAPLPVPSSATATTFDVISADDAWAAVAEQDGDVTQAVLLHWDGASWSPSTLPEIGSIGSAILAIDDAGSDDVWAVGNRIGVGGGDSPLALHRDGSTWMVVPTPSIEPDAAFVDVVATGPTDAWARVTTAMRGGAPTTHLLRWNGSSWLDERAHGGDERFSDLAAGPSGTWLFASGRPRLLQHWDGRAWESTPKLPNDERLTGTMLWHFTKLIAVEAGVVAVRMGPGGVTAFEYTCG